MIPTALLLAAGKVTVVGLLIRWIATVYIGVSLGRKAMESGAVFRMVRGGIEVIPSTHPQAHLPRIEPPLLPVIPTNPFPRSQHALQAEAPELLDRPPRDDAA